MQQLVYAETHDWSAFTKSSIPVTISIVRNPHGYAVYISTEENPRGQVLTAEQAEIMFHEMAMCFWRLNIRPTIKPAPSKERVPVYCVKCGEQIGTVSTEIEDAEVVREYRFRNDLIKRCCRGTRNKIIR